MGWNEYGQLGLGDHVHRDAPTQLTYFSHNNLVVTQIFAGAWNSVFLVKEGKQS